jgi:hypothetical protein
MEIVELLFAGRPNRCMLFAYPGPERYESGDEELTVLPLHTKVMVASISIQGRSAGVCQKDCCSWRLPHAGDLASGYPGIMLRLCFSAWFFFF